MKITAGHISNLTDARYFAAWDVERMVYRVVSANTLSQLGEIINWVSGPEPILYALDMDATEALERSRYIGAVGTMNRPDDLNSRTVLIYMDSYREFWAMGVPMVWDFKAGQEELDQAIINDVAVYLSFKHYKVDELIALYMAHEHIGIYVEGGQEEKVGFKSYDYLDELLEGLSEELKHVD